MKAILGFEATFAWIIGDHLSVIALFFELWKETYVSWFAIKDNLAQNDMYTKRIE